MVTNENLINPAHVCQFIHLYAEYGRVNFTVMWIIYKAILVSFR